MGRWPSRVFGFASLTPFAGLGDIALAAVVLEANAVCVYGAARLTTLTIPVALNLIASRALPQLRALGAETGTPAFRAAAARFNLGIVLISGAIAVLLLWAGPPVLTALGVPLPGLAENLLTWLLLGQSAPVLFGATTVIMRASGRGSFVGLSRLIGAGLFGSSVLWAGLVVGMIEPLFMAQALVASQLAQAALCAILLTQAGVWPGLTALLHPQIRLR